MGKDDVVASEELLVLIVRDAALRGALIGHLSLDGELLITYDGPVDDAALDRSARPPAILITDDDDVAALFATLAGGGRWIGFIHLTDGHAAPAPGEQVACVGRAAAPLRIRETLLRWRGASS